MHRFWDIRLLSTVTLKPGLQSLKIIENDTIQSGIHDFLLTFHNNHRPISHRFWDKRRFLSNIARKSPIFPPLHLTPQLKGLPLELGIGAGVIRMMRLQDGRKRFKIGLAVLIQYRRVTDRHPATVCWRNDALFWNFRYSVQKWFVQTRFRILYDGEKQESVKTGNCRCGLQRLRELVAVIESRDLLCFTFHLKRLKLRGRFVCEHIPGRASEWIQRGRQ